MAFWLQLDHWVDNLMGCIKLMTKPTLQRLNAAATPLWAYHCSTTPTTQLSPLWANVLVNVLPFLHPLSWDHVRQCSGIYWPIILAPFNFKITCLILSFFPGKASETPFQHHFHDKIGLFSLTAFNVCYFGQNCIFSWRNRSETPIFWNLIQRWCCALINFDSKVMLRSDRGYFGKTECCGKPESGSRSTLDPASGQVYKYLLPR